MQLDSAIFYSNDIQKVIPFYRDVLEFTLDYQSERFVSFVFPNGARLGIKNQQREREIPGHQTVFIGVENIEQLWNEIRKDNVEIFSELETFPWGKEFSLLDADKNRVLFIERP